MNMKSKIVIMLVSLMLSFASTSVADDYMQKTWELGSFNCIGYMDVGDPEPGLYPTYWVDARTLYPPYMANIIRVHTYLQVDSSSGNSTYDEIAMTEYGGSMVTVIAEGTVPEGGHVTGYTATTIHACVVGGKVLQGETVLSNHHS
jgi:hypothetical protein